MSVDLSDPAIQSAYTAIVRLEPINWLLLSYGQTRDTLSLLDSGTGGVEELQKTLGTVEDDPYFAFVREEKSFALINYFPTGIPGVRRARALVHARAVTSLFKSSNVTITISNPEQVEISAIRAKLGLERLPPHEKAPRAANGLQLIRDRASATVSAELTTPQVHAPPQSSNSRLPRPAAISNRYHRTEDTPPPPPPAKASLLLKRVSNEKRDGPLPPPPANASDTEDYELINAPTPTASNILSRPRGISLATSDHRSEYSVDSELPGYRPRPRGYSEQSSELGYLSSGGVASPPAVFRTEAQEQAALSRAKWAREEAGFSSDYDSPSRKPRRGRTKSDIQREREQEEIEVARAAAEAAARRKYEKEQEALREAEEQERARIQFQEAQRRRAADRLRREQQRREDEEREALAAEKRRLAAQQRRLEDARRAEERRKEEQRRNEERERREEERKRSVEMERQGRMKEIQRKFDNLRVNAGILLTGYVSVQPPSSITWRRRFFQLQSDCMLFFKNSEETNKVLDSFELKGSVTGIKEWSEGYDDIRAIPHSFAIEFIDEPAWLLFADSSEDKEILVSLILQLAKL